ncbi:hypothetical protein C0585_03990 [Candidatus Woesearchaeota archaeon]|nr:MAG: hypothetical protein C0585_03990 [Candidatus Woesearchaeota archaeon]
MIKFQEGELKLLWRFYISRFLGDSFNIFLFYWIVYMKNLFSFTELSILIIIFSVSPVLFEIPTGVFADIYGRKSSVLVGYFLLSCGFILIGLTTNYFLLMALFVLIGLSVAFTSGALNAWPIDKLIDNNRTNLQTSFFQKNAIINSFSKFMAAIVGIISVKYLPFNFIWFITSFGIFLSIFILFFEKEHFERKADKLKDAYIEFGKTLKKGVKYTLNHKNLLLASFSLIVFFAAFSFSNISWEPEAMNLGLPLNLLGLFALFNSILGYLIASNYGKVTKRVGVKKTLILGIIIYSLIHFFAIRIYEPYFFLFIYALKDSMWMGYLSPLYFGMLHDFYESKIRATLESLLSMVLSGSMLIFIFLGGLLNDFLGPRFAIFTTGVLVLLTIPILNKVNHK